MVEKGKSPAEALIGDHVREAFPEQADVIATSIVGFAAHMKMNVNMVVLLLLMTALRNMQYEEEAHGLQGVADLLGESALFTDFLTGVTSAMRQKIGS